MRGITGTNRADYKTWRGTGLLAPWMITNNKNKYRCIDTSLWSKRLFNSSYKEKETSNSTIEPNTDTSWLPNGFSSWLPNVFPSVWFSTRLVMNSLPLFLSDVLLNISSVSRKTYAPLLYIKGMRRQFVRNKIWNFVIFFNFVKIFSRQ